MPAYLRKAVAFKDSGSFCYIMGMFKIGGYSSVPANRLGTDTESKSYCMLTRGSFLTWRMMNYFWGGVAYLWGTLGGVGNLLAVTSFCTICGLGGLGIISISLKLSSIDPDSSPNFVIGIHSSYPFKEHNWITSNSTEPMNRSPSRTVKLICPSRLGSWIFYNWFHSANTGGKGSLTVALAMAWGTTAEVFGFWSLYDV